VFVERASEEKKRTRLRFYNVLGIDCQYWERFEALVRYSPSFQILPISRELTRYFPDADPDRPVETWQDEFRRLAPFYGVLRYITWSYERPPKIAPEQGCIDVVTLRPPVYYVCAGLGKGIYLLIYL
jgi:hypothetical protein